MTYIVYDTVWQKKRRGEGCLAIETGSSRYLRESTTECVGCGVALKLCQRPFTFLLGRGNEGLSGHHWYHKLACV